VTLPRATASSGALRVEREGRTATATNLLSASIMGRLKRCRRALPYAAGAGLCPAGGSQTESRPKCEHLGRLVRLLEHALKLKEGARGGTRGSPTLYGQLPLMMSEPGPVFFQVSAPTVDSMQYVVEPADWMTMFLTPWSYVDCR